MASSSSVNLGGLAARLGEVGVGVAALQHHRHEAGIPLPGGHLGRLDVLGGVDDGDGDADVLGKPDLGVGWAMGADGLDREAVAQHRVVADLLQLRIREPQPGAPPSCRVLPPTLTSTSW